MNPNNLSNDYTTDDHLYRDEDAYALAKYRLTLRWLRSVEASGRLLNVGCGSGVFNDLAFQAGFSVTAVEPDPVAWAMALSRADARYPVHNLGIFDLTDTEPFDIVVLHDVLEHIESDELAVATIVNLLRPGGRAVISVPALESLFGHHDRLLGHYRRYSKRSLNGVLSPQLLVDKCRYLGISGIPLVFWYSRVEKKPYPKTTQNRFVGVLFSLICALEERISPPFGTSVLALAHRPVTTVARINRL